MHLCINFKVLFSVTAVACVINPADLFALPAATFSWIGKLPGDQSSYAYAISGDGTTVVGASYTDSSSPTGVIRSFRWTASAGITLIGDLPGGSESTQAYDVSYNGTVVAGASSSALSYSHHPYYDEPFYWSPESGMVGLGYLPGTDGRYGGAMAVSGDGLVVIGTSTGDRASGGTRPFRWTAQTGMVDLGDMDTEWGNQDSANATNYDGSVIVGMSQLGWNRTAFRWTEATGMNPLGYLPGAGDGGREKYSFASDLSGDGAVVVGSAYSNDGGIEAFRWTEDMGMVGLGKLPNAAIPSSAAAAISADGSIIVGDAIDSGRTTRAVLWHRAGKIRLIQDLLVDAGLGSMLSGTVLTSATDISADGRTVVGWGYGPGGIQGWVAGLPIPEPAAGVLLALFAGPAVLRRRA